MFQPLSPSNAKPDMAMLRLIKESELQRGNIIGSGAFGTVYKVVTHSLTTSLTNSLSVVLTHIPVGH